MHIIKHIMYAHSHSHTLGKCLSGHRSLQEEKTSYADVTHQMCVHSLVRLFFYLFIEQISLPLFIVPYDKNRAAFSHRNTIFSMFFHSE